MARRQQPLFLGRYLLRAPFRESLHKGLNSVRLLRVGMWSMAKLAETHPGVLSGKGVLLANSSYHNLNAFDCKARPPLVHDGPIYGVDV
jgi:hypothetical protein